ncbi:MAG: PAS domain S-box protein [Burkholderiaceae bacterium]|nr:PAS domain S-box protein [Burkholderiaceae bacterium]
MAAARPSAPPAATTAPSPAPDRPDPGGKKSAQASRQPSKAQAAQTLQSEVAFRRALENAMTVGLRVLDLQGRITYVNAAFCRMTGWPEDELLGQCAPFSYWAEEDWTVYATYLARELSGQTDPCRGMQMRVKRKDGSLFDARLYISPLLDADGQHTGWLATMTDITGPASIRRELAASQERFITVLGALDAAVSVAPLGSKDLLYANRQYRRWFGDGAAGHLMLLERGGTAQPHDHTDKHLRAADTWVGLPADSPGADHTAGRVEVHVEHLDRWLEVRSRYLTWVDGRLAQIVIAADITSRHRAEEQAALQTERAETASRLITMGEMASSVAHELNQPLTAISNYCHGIIRRIETGRIEPAELLAALEKTAHQAQRAGQVITHIRSFIKRSEPNRQWTRAEAVVEQAVELAGIALRRRQVRLTWHCAPELPPLLADPILIEQALLNLLKNGAESIDAARRGAANRVVDLRVDSDALDGLAAVRFTISDTGGGLSSQVQTRLYETFFSTKSDGLGIGLSLCRSIVEAHQGRITAKNIYNGKNITGCRFTVWIPAATSTEPPAIHESETRARPGLYRR